MPKFKPLPTQQELHELFDYSVITGDLYWKKQINSRALKGSIAGPKKTGFGYKRIRIKGIEYVQHRIIWCWVTGDDPGTLEVDHRNNQRDCNAWHNLRLATRSQNTANTPGAKGVQQDAWGGWNARVYINNTHVCLGRHKTEAEAVAAYRKGSLKYHGEFSRYSGE